MRSVLLRLGRDRGLWLLAALAYLPALTAAPGRMPADSKLYLYLDPQRLMSDGFHNFDPRQFAGWVPHQHIAYLWPSGPWFSAFEIIGIPDWIAHRLWIGTLLLLAGLGVRWVAGLLGLSPGGALVAAVGYQCSPYLLPYVSRTSVMLLPWAGLGWIVGLTVLATLRSRWRHAALLALVVFTVGAVNATALAMIVPAPVLWLVHAAWSGTTSWRNATATALRVGVLCTVVSLWWIAALLLQGRHGADVLAYSETLEAVTFTSTSSEVLRGLGYWLFYVRDPFAATTTAAADHLVSGRTVTIGLVVVLIGLAGLVLTRWAERRFAALLVGTGVVLGVGLHPFDDPSPLMRILTGGGESGLALALRSSTRAVPMSVLGLALGAGALVTAARRFDHRLDRGPSVPLQPSTAAGVAVVVLAVAGLPALWTGGFVDPALERDQHPPAAWLDAVADLDARAEGHRVLQVPGAEFGAFRWGYTVDQPIPGLSDTPLVTRDLLPLGSPPAMDLLYALDDRFQQGTLEPAAVAPIARLLGAATVWLTNDLAYDRFRTPRPDTVAELFRDGADGLARPRMFGDRAVNRAEVPVVDEEWIRRHGDPTALEPVWLLDVDDPVPVVRAATRELLLVGDGAGAVDAAAAGLLRPDHLVRSASTLDDDELALAVERADIVVVTDTDRPRARHWRGSQDTLGFTEDGSGRPGVLRTADGDARLEYAARDGSDHRTIAVQRGPVTARVTGYGEPFAYRPEDRAAMALDGDTSTAWRVADRFDAIGEAIELELEAPTDHLVLRQPDTAPGARRITMVDVVVDGGPTRPVPLDERSLHDPGQRIDLDAPGSTVRITIAATDATPGHPEAWGSVGFAVVDAGLGPTTEVVRAPIVGLDRTPPETPVAIVLTRERVRPTDRWRADPEDVLRREVVLPHEREMAAAFTVRLDRRAADDVLADLLGIAGAVASARLPGTPGAAGWAAVDGDDSTAWVSPFGSAVGATLLVPTVPGAEVDELVVTQRLDPWYSTITGLRIHDPDGGHLDVVVPAPDAQGRSTIGLGTAVDGPVTVEVTEVDERTTIDRRYGEPTVLPVAIAGIAGAGIAAADVPDVLDTGCRDDLVRIDGAPVALRVTGPIGDLLRGDPARVTACDDPSLAIPAGAVLVETAPGATTGLQIDRVVLADLPAAADADADPGLAAPVVRPGAEVLRSERTTRTVAVDACPVGCWFVLGEGYNPAWRATVDGAPLPGPSMVDGGFNGWWLAPSDEARTVTAVWSPQPVLTTALTLSVIGLALVGGLVAVDRRRRPLADPDRPSFARRGERTPVDRRRLTVVGLAWCVLAGLVVAPLWALVPIPVVAVTLLTRSTRPAGFVALGLGVVGAVTIVWRVVQWRPFPDAGWVLDFDDLHRPGLFLVTALLATAVLPDRAPGRRS